MACPAGKYQDQIGQASCIQCPSGKTTVDLLFATAWPGNYPSPSSTNTETNTSSLKLILTLILILVLILILILILIHVKIGGSTSVGTDGYVYYGAHSASKCVSPPEGYILESGALYIGAGYQSYVGDTMWYQGSPPFDFYVACPDQYTVTSTGTQQGCSYCAQSQVFYAGGKRLNSYDGPAGNGIFMSNSNMNNNLYYYGEYIYIYGTIGRTSQTSSVYKYLYELNFQLESAKCLDSCPTGYETAETEQPGKKKCSKCQKSRGEYGSAAGVCSLCPEESYPAQDGTTQCTSCGWP